MSNKCQQIIMWSRTIPESFDVFLPMLGGPSAWSNSQLPLLEPRRQMSNHPWGYRNDPFGHHTNHSMIIFTRLYVYIYIFIYVYVVRVTCVYSFLCSYMFMYVLIVHILFTMNQISFLPFQCLYALSHIRKASVLSWNGWCRLFRSPPMSGTISTPAMLGLKDSKNWSTAVVNPERFRLESLVLSYHTLGI